MTDKEIKAYIDLAVERAVEGYKRAGLLVDQKNVLYADADGLLKKYMAEGRKDAAITYAIQGLRFDPYFRIIELYYGEGMTNERIAGELGVDVTTVIRNKQRLCIKIYEAVI